MDSGNSGDEVLPRRHSQTLANVPGARAAPRPLAAAASACLATMTDQRRTGLGSRDED